MSSGRFLCQPWAEVALGVAVASAFALGCTAPTPTLAASPAMSVTPPPRVASQLGPTRSFDEDVAFLEQHGTLEILSSETGGRVAVSGQYQARVMTSAVGAGGRSLGFINRQFITAGKTATAFDNYGGEDRFWLGPEGGQYGLYFAPGQPFDFEHWQTPHALQEGAWHARTKTPTSITYEHAFSVANHTQRDFKVNVEREIALVSTEQASQRLGVSLSKTLSWIGYATTNKLTNVGTDAWTEQTGLLSIWILGMFAPAPGTNVIVPFESSGTGEIVNDRYFGKVPADRLAVHENPAYLLFRADGKYRSKIGLGPTRAKAVLGSYSAPAQLLTLVLFSKPAGAARYVNSMWEQQAQPYGGDVVNSYNDGPPAPGKPALGGFYEIESSSPAAALAPGESLTHTHQTYHFSGPRAELDALCKSVLGVSLEALPAE
ncbi:MAG: DUF6786 family protein [Pseudomonadota bacterium]